MTHGEHIDLSTLVDPGSFLPISPPHHDGTSVGWATISDRRVVTYIQRRDHISPEDAADICDGMDLAISAGVPIVGLLGTPEAQPRWTVQGLAAYARILDRQVRCSGVVPQISVVTGQVVGGLAQAATLSDLTVCVEGATTIYMSGPTAVETITGEKVTAEELGGATMHASRSALADLLAPTVDAALASVRYLMSYLPDNNLQSPPYFPPTDVADRSCDALRAVVPESTNVPYDIRDLISEVVDDGEFLELQDSHARNLVISLARLDGYSIGIVASQPSSLAGTLDIESSVKGARFVRFCDSFNIPLVTFVDTPGFRPGVQEEFRGIIRHGAKLVYAYAEATVPRITVIVRKAYGGAYIVMNSRHIRADLSLALPGAEIAVMGAEGAARIIHRREIAAADDPEERQANLAEEYRYTFSNPYRAAERGYVDDVIAPEDTRKHLIRAFEMLRDKRETLPRRKHGNIPL